MQMLRTPTHRRQHRIGLLVTFLLLVSVLVTVTETPSSATVPGANGKIAYAREGRIWTMNADGSDQVRLTSPFVFATFNDPAWSPDGTKIAVLLNLHPVGMADDIAVMNADGTGITILTGTAGIYEFGPTWSPDGTKIAYAREWTIWTMNADGSDQTQLTDPPGTIVHFDPAWSPDGTRIVYHRSAMSGVGNEIEVVNADGTGTTINLTQTPAIAESSPTWSPDGTKIAYKRDSVIWTMNADGSDQSRLTSGHASIWCTAPAWSPDGTKIAYQQRLDGADDEIRVINADGTGSTNLTQTSGADEYRPSWQPLNRPPVAVNNSYPTPYETTLNVAAPGVLGNDSDPDGNALAVQNPAGAVAPNGTVTMAADGSFTYVPDAGYSGNDTFTYSITDGSGSMVSIALVTIAVAAPGVPSFVDVTVGLVSPVTGKWYLRNSVGTVTTFYYGNPGDVPFTGDWNCNGVDTPGLFRTSDAYAYLRDTNTQGIADIRFFFGNPSDIPLAGDFNGDGCDTLSIYRPSEARFYIMNELGENEGGLGAADYSFLFGNPGDKPVVGDWDGDGIDEIGLHRESTGFFYYRNTLDTGVADGEFYFGDPGDRFVAGDWGIIDGLDTPAVFRPSNTVFYFRHTLSAGNADAQFTWTGAGTTWLPVAGDFNLG